MFTLVVAFTVLPSALSKVASKIVSRHATSNGVRPVTIGAPGVKLIALAWFSTLPKVGAAAGAPTPVNGVGAPLPLDDRFDPGARAIPAIPTVGEAAATLASHSLINPEFSITGTPSKKVCDSCSATSC